MGRHKWGRRANLLSAVISWLTQCGKTWEWRRPPHLLLAAGPMVDSMWEDWSRRGYITNVRDMSAFCPTVGRGATDLVKILITTKRWHSCGNLNFILSVFVALTTSSIYIAVLLRPGTFPFWYRHRACDLRAGAVFFVGHRLKSSTNSPKFVLWLPEVTCFDDSTRKFDALFVCSSEFCMRMTTHTVTTVKSMPTTAGCDANLYPRTILFFWFCLDPFSVLPGVACQWWTNAQAGSCTCSRGLCKRHVFLSVLTDVFYMCSICWFGAMVWRNVLIDIAWHCSNVTRFQNRQLLWFTEKRL